MRTVECPYCRTQLAPPETGIREVVCAGCGRDYTLPDEVFADYESAAETIESFTVGPYRVEKLLGEGAFGLVHEALQLEPVKRRVALKMLKRGVDSEQVVTRFRLEQQALAQMSHPNVAGVYDAGTTEEGLPYFAMELVRGVPITNYCDSNALNLRARIRLLIQACQAVQHAHQKGVIHRDIKPSNILVAESDDGTPVVKVIDFGIAKATGSEIDAATIATEIGTVLGTAQYMSPEQASGSENIDTRTDSYSLGIVLYELLAGNPPFLKEDLKQAGFLAALQIIAEQERPRPHTRLGSDPKTTGEIARARSTQIRRLREKLRGELEAIVMKSIEKDPSERYQTADALGEDLRRYLHNLPIEARSASPWYHMRKFARRHAPLISGILLLLATIVGGSAVSVSQAIRATRAEREATDNLETANQQTKAAESAQKKAEEALAKAEEATRQANEARKQTEQQKRLAEQQQAAAETEKEKAEAVSQFLIRSFQSPSPFRSGKDVTMASVLEKSVRQLDQRDDLSPEVEASLYHVLGQTYGSLGESSRSLELLNKALSVCPSDQPLLLASVQYAIGYQKQSDGLIEDSIVHFSKSLEIVTQTEGENSPRALSAMNQLLFNYRSLKLNEQAEQLREKIRELFGSDENKSPLDSLIQEADDALATGDLKRSIESRKKAYEFAEINLGSNNETTLQTLYNLGWTYDRLAALESAESAFLELYNRISKVGGENHVFAFRALFHLGLIMYQQEEIEESIEFFEKGLASSEKIESPPSHELATTRIFLGLGYLLTDRPRLTLETIQDFTPPEEEKISANEYLKVARNTGLGLAKFRLGSFEEAVPLLLSAIENWSALEIEGRKEFSPNRITVSRALAECEAHSGKWKEALKRQNEEIRKLSENLGENHTEVLNAKADLARIYSAAGENAKASRHLDQVITQVRLAHGETGIETIRMIRKAASIEDEIGEQSAAAIRLQEEIDRLEEGSKTKYTRNIVNEPWRIELVEIYRDIIEIYRAKVGESDIRTLKFENELVSEYFGLRRYKEGATRAESILPHWLSEAGPKSSDTLYCRELLALCLSSLGEHDRAIELYRENRAIKESQFGENNYTTLGTMENLALALDRSGHPEEAETIFRRTLQLYQEGWGDDAHDTIWTKSNLASVLDDQGKTIEALSLKKEVVESFRKTLGENNADTLGAMVDLGKAHSTLKEFDEAAKAWERAYYIAVELEKHGTLRDYLHSANTAGRLARLFRETGDTLKEKQWRAKEVYSN